MPNPDFTGDVRARRCETCRQWNRIVAADAAELRVGVCEVLVEAMTRTLTTERPLSGAATPMLVSTLDLAVCSDWTAKTGGGD